MIYSNKEIGGALIALAVALLLGWLTGAYAVTLVIALVLIIGWYHVNLVRTARWARRPLSQPPPLGSPFWAVVQSVRSSIANARAGKRGALAQIANIREVTRALPDAAVVLDVNGEVVAYNDAARSLLKIESGDESASIGVLLRHPDIVALLREDNAERLSEIASPFHEGQRLEVRSFDAGGRYQLLLARDVSQLNRLLSMRQDFIANVSHELRTPLTVLFGYLESAKTAEPPLAPSELVDVLDKLDPPTRRMRALVDDLLLLTRLEASPTPEADERLLVDMPALIEKAAREARGLSDGSHTITSTTDGAQLLEGIESELYSALINLISNAVRYSPEGGRIEVQWSECAKGARLSVTDEGMGIPPEHLARLTERFYRVDLAGSRVRGGTGLGLAITKHVLKRHHSELRIESEVGVGSRFFCDFDSTYLAPKTQPKRN